MSRIGKIPVSVPKEVKILVNGQSVQVEGPKGKLNLTVPYRVSVEVKDGILKVSRSANAKQDMANHGTTRAHLVNMIEGVSKGHKKELEIQGVGFRAVLQGNKVIFNIGLSHQVEFPVPAAVKVSIPTPTNIIVEGVDNAAVGQVAASMRALKPAEPYKGKGLRYAGEIVRRKQGKSVTK